MTRTSCDIFISGGGIAGLSAAAVFGTAGYTVVLADPAEAVTDAAAPGADLRTTAILAPGRALLERAGVWAGLSSEATALRVMRIVDGSAEPPVARDFRAVDIDADAFGWNVPNTALRRGLLDRLSALGNVTLKTGTGFARLVARHSGALIELSDGSRLQARLVVGADGRSSPVRQAAGIDVTKRRYGQKALVFAVGHAQPHDGVSTEVHLSGGPFTLVPLPNRDGRPASSVVWMVEAAEADRLLALDTASFEREATDRSTGVLGDLALISDRQAWPIIAQEARSLTSRRVALVAEAAHVVPPIGAQGLNMSLSDIALLGDLSESAGDDLGGDDMLRRYALRRRADIALRVNGVDLLNRVSMSGNPLLQAARARGVGALHDLPPVRNLLMRLGMGGSAGS